MSGNTFKNASGSYVINGHTGAAGTAGSGYGRFVAAGTVFEYHRPSSLRTTLESGLRETGDKSQRAEYILAPGPINSSIDVLVRTCALYTFLKAVTCTDGNNFRHVANCIISVVWYIGIFARW